MQSVSSKIWTCVAVSISYDDNHYTTGISTLKKKKQTFFYAIKPKQPTNQLFSFLWAMWFGPYA